MKNNSSIMKYITSNLLFTLLITLALSFQLAAQHQPDDILIGDRNIPQVMVVGTFHFGYPNLDAYKINEDDQVDIRSLAKQKEVEELVSYLAQFKPTKIVVEGGRNSGYIIRRYERWLAGGELAPNEIDQLAFRLMKQFELDTLYGCDAPGLTYTMSQHPDSLALNRFVDEIFAGYDWQSDDPMDQIYTDFYDAETKLTLTMPLLDYFKHLNSDAVVKRYHGAYLIGDFKADDYRGADALAMYWYSRNLRIFRNIQQVVESPNDRILVLFGAGHSSILKQQFESTPEFELIEFNELDQFSPTN